MPNKAFMVKAIANQLKKRRIEPDLVDLEAEVDSTLSLQENYNHVLRSYGGLGKRNISQSSRNTKKIENMMKARERFENLNRSRQSRDARIKAKRTFSLNELKDKNYKMWSKNINRYDIEGVDFIVGYSKTRRKTVKKRKR